MNKFNLRQEYKLKRNLISTDQRTVYSKKISNLLIENFDFKNKTVHTFLSVNQLKEIDTTFINDFMFSRSKNVATSVTNYNTLTLEHSIINSQTIFRLDKFKIPTPIAIEPIHPKSLDIVLVPLLTFDKYGNRIGYGKGLYDSFLSECKEDCIKIGLSFFEACSENITLEKHDIKLNYCVTPFKIYKF